MEHQPILLSVEEIALKLKEAAQFIGQRVINRDEVIEQAFCALLTGEHLLLQSRTGVGKTLLAEQIFAMFEGARVFRIQASKEQQPDSYFGGLDLELLKKGILKHNTEGSLVESEFGFIDEIFDANDFTLRALLSLLNERRLIRGTHHQPARIHTVIAATNYLRVSEVTEAILDRFVYKALILPDKEPYVQFKIAQKYLVHGGKPAEPPRKIPFSELKYMHTIITGNNPDITITIRPEDLYFANLVIRHFEHLRNRALRESNRGRSAEQIREFYISPRTQAKSIDLLRALALLRARTYVTHEDISKLYFIFATVGVPEEIALFKKAFETIQNSLTSSNGFEQIATLLAFETLLQHIRQDRSILEQPLGELATTPIRRTFIEWFKETFGGVDKTVAHNRRQLEQFIADFVPATEEVRELKIAVERLMTRVFQEIERDQAREAERQRRRQELSSNS
ncbi:MAG: AAA family ATPase [Bacteroidota bacterium]|nr:MoxR family ATPase [Candidatus Kapabacteria bacterium]MCS7303189.1 MoxR family ATPase [Candidatus Kapabacteria bacterium]MCX7937015.1 MoxR family ATPase [Chlorobiota bacterium]MDW8075486.1 AAA family ATPase [Bacteroidota bacterium]MDW8272343.1 AAA family ATPase [Bacteroidota bacterium]